MNINSRDLKTLLFCIRKCKRLAQYGEMLDYPYRVDMWQYTQSGTVPGITGYVDINLLFEYQDEEMEN